MTLPLAPFAVLLGLATGLPGCADAAGGADSEPTSPAPEATMTITVTSPAFGEGESIPQQYTCSGDNISPPLEISGVPDGTVELALLVEDPDAPRRTFLHWAAWGIDPQTSTLEEGALPAGTVEGRNDLGYTGYGGPCPPPGPAHRYIFTVFALSERPDLPAAAPAGELRDAVAGKVLATGTLTGEYGR